MDKNILVEQDLQSGKSLVDGLAKRGLPVQLAAWVRRAFESRYILFLASPNVQTSDSRKIYRVISETLSQENIPLDSSDIYIAPTTGLSDEEMHSFSTIIAGDGLTEEVLVYTSPEKLKASRHLAPQA